MYLAVKKFRHFIEGRQFILFTGHKPLTFALSSASDKWSPSQQRHLAFVSEFTIKVMCQEPTMWWLMPCPEYLWKTMNQT